MDAATLHEIVSPAGFIPLFSTPSLEKDKQVLAALMAAAKRLNLKQLAVEITCRFDGWPERVAQIVAHAKTEYVDAMVIGTGSLLELRQVSIMHNNGSQFVVSHGYVPGMIETCRNSGMACTPTAGTSQEMRKLDEDFGEGDGWIKFFPSRTGVDVLNDCLEPFGSGDVLGDGSVRYGKRWVVPTKLSEQDFGLPEKWFRVRHPRAEVAALGMSGSVLKRDLIEGGQWKALEEEIYRAGENIRSARARIK